MENKNLLDISWESILKIAFSLLVVYFLFLIKDILILVIFALIVSILFNPVIDFLQKIKFPRVLAAGLTYSLIFGGLGFLIYFITLNFIPEIQQFTETLPQYFERIAPPLKGLGIEAFENFDDFVKVLEGWLIGASGNIFTALFAFFGSAFSAISVIFLAFFFSLEEKAIEKTIRLLFPKRQEDLALSVWNKSQKKISGWFAARIICCLFVGIASFIALKLFKVDYSFSLGLFAGITNFIPYLGPIIAGAFITILVFVQDWTKAIFILIAFFLIQQVEGNILSPVLTKKIIGLPSALVLVSLIIGARLWGIFGMILVVPLAGILFEFIRDFLKKKKEKHNEIEEESSKAIVM